MAEKLYASKKMANAKFDEVLDATVRSMQNTNLTLGNLAMSALINFKGDDENGSGRNKTQLEKLLNTLNTCKAFKGKKDFTNWLYIAMGCYSEDDKGVRSLDTTKMARGKQNDESYLHKTELSISVNKDTEEITIHVVPVKQRDLTWRDIDLDWASRTPWDNLPKAAKKKAAENAAVTAAKAIKKAFKAMSEDTKKTYTKEEYKAITEARQILLEVPSLRHIFESKK